MEMRRVFWCETVAVMFSLFFLQLSILASLEVCAAAAGESSSALDFLKWRVWSDCSADCTQQRSSMPCPRDSTARTCQIITETRPCFEPPCKYLRVAVPKQKKSSTTTPKQLFSDWTIWSRCTRTCKKRRYRYCVKRRQCDNDVLMEEKACAPLGSLCARMSVRSDSSAGDVESYEETESREEEREETGRRREEERDETTDTVTCGVSVIDKPNLKISGGRPSVHGKWPWQVAMLNRFKEPYCGGTLISRNWVITAAHCVKRKMFVLAGDFHLRKSEGSEQLLRVSQGIRHPNYNHISYQNDIGLVRLARPMTVSDYVRPACLPGEQLRLRTGSKCSIVGWGKKRDSHIWGTDILHEAQVPLVDARTCRRAYRSFRITSNMQCAGFQGGKIDSCGGDSGGPLLCKTDNDQYAVYGITSFGEGCGDSGKYGVYTKVTSYLPWLRKTMATNLTSNREHSHDSRASRYDPVTMFLMRLRDLLSTDFTFFR